MISIRGQTPSITSKPESRNYSIVIAMDNYGILGYMIFTEGVKSEDYILFLYTFVTQEFLEMSTKKVIFFMDNCSIH